MNILTKELKKPFKASRLCKKARIKNFLSVVRIRKIKRFVFKKTKFKRRTARRRKHKTTWLMYTNAFRGWQKDFMHTKHIAKHQFLFNICTNNYLFLECGSIKNTHPDVFLNSNILYSVAKKKTFIKDHNMNVNTIKNISMAYAWFNESLETNAYGVPLLTQWDNVFYDYDTADQNNNIFDLNTILGTAWDLNLIQLIELRSLCISATLLLTANNE